MSTKLSCPTCQKPVLPRAENKGFPFCSMRCRQVDLGRWLGEEFRVPTQQPEEEEDAGGGREDRGGNGDSGENGHLN